MHIAHDKFRPSSSKDSRKSPPKSSTARLSDPVVVVAVDARRFILFSDDRQTTDEALDGTHTSTERRVSRSIRRASRPANDSPMSAFSVDRETPTGSVGPSVRRSVRFVEL